MRALPALLIVLSLAAWLPVAGEPLGAAAGAPAEQTRLLVYFSNDGLAGGAMNCTAVFPRERAVPKTARVATAALQALFAGPTAAERQAGYHSVFSPATAGLLKGLRITRGTAYLDLQDLRDELAGASSSCGAAQLRSQIEQTLRQFPGVSRVRYAIDGEPRRFYDWMNEPCDATNDHCNPRPFRSRR